MVTAGRVAGRKRAAAALRGSYRSRAAKLHLPLLTSTVEVSGACTADLPVQHYLLPGRNLRAAIGEGVYMGGRCFYYGDTGCLAVAAGIIFSCQGAAARLGRCYHRRSCKGNCFLVTGTFKGSFAGPFYGPV